MATYYWVGGAGTWNASSTTNWASSSGGTGGAGVPTSADNVIFDANSGTGTIGIASGTCNDLTASSSSALTFSGNNSVYGSSAVGGSGTFTAWTPTYSATSTGKTIASGGKTVGATTFNGVGGEWTLSDAMTLSSTNIITVTAGSFLTNGFNITAYEILSSGNVARSINFGSSTITLDSNNDFISFSGSNLTFNAGTSTIVSTGASGDFVGGGYTFYNLTFNTVSTGGTSVINGGNTFNNFTVNEPLGTGYRIINLATNQVINGTFSCLSSAANKRIKIQSTTSTQRTITAAAVSLNYVDFYGIVGAGAASWTGTSIGNGTLNSGITFTAPKTVYWNLAAGGNWMTSTAWATTSGGTAAVANFPLPQDTANIVNTGLSTSATISINTANVLLSNIDFSARTNAMTFNFNAASSACGSITWDAQVTSSGTSAVSFYGSTTLTSAGVTLTPPITVTAGATLTTSGATTTTNTLTSNGTFTLGANATFTTLALNGTTNLSTYTLTGTTCTLGVSSTTNFGTGKISLSGSGATIFTGSANQTITGTPLIECTYSGATGTRTISPAAPTEANTVNISVTAGTDIFTNTASGSVKNLNFTGFAGTWSNVATSIYGSLTVSSGMTLTAGTNAITFAGTSGPYTITSNSKTLDFPITFNGAGGTWKPADSFLQGSTRATTLTNGTLDLNGQTYTCGSFATAAGTKNLTFNGGTLTVPAVTTTAFNNAVPTGFTTTAGTGTGKISMTGATAKTFVGGGSTYNCTLEQAGAGALTITGSNTLNNITNTTQPVSVLFTAGTTNTFDNFNLSGISGNLVTIGSVTAASHTLSKSSGTVSVNYCTISRSTATGGALWQAYTTNGNVNGGNNSGWDFGASGNGLLFGSNF